MAVNTLGHLFVRQANPASAEDPGEVERFAGTVRAVTDDYVEIAWMHQSYTRERTANAVARQGIALEFVKLPETKRGSVTLLPRWIVERSFACNIHFRHLVKNYGWCAETLAVIMVGVSTCLKTKQADARVTGL